jgi:hypothetical protein
MTFTTGDTINFSSTNETTFWSNITMRFGTGVRIQFIETQPDGYLQPCDVIQIVWPVAYQAEPCSWWEVLDPLGNPTGIEFHIDGQYGPDEFHVDQVIYMGPPPIPPLPSQPVTAEKKIEHVSPCDYFVVHRPVEWYPPECSWWEIMDPETGLPTGFEFHVDWTNESCEFHVDEVYPHYYVPWYPGAYEIQARQKITQIKPCDWFVVLDPMGLVPSPCSWWDVWRKGMPYVGRFHVDSVVGRAFHVDQTIPNPIDLSVSPEYPTVARQVMSSLASCQWCKVDDLAKTPIAGTWWHLNIGQIDVEFYVDQSYGNNGTFHLGMVLPTDPMPFLPGQAQSYVVAEKKFVGLGPCDWFQVANPQGWLPEPCSWWKVTWPTQWAGVSFHIDSTDGISKFHIDAADPLPPGPTPPPWNVTAIRGQPPSGPWYVKPAYPDYAPSGMPDFDENQDAWGPGPGIYTWCGPVAVANSLWWLDSEFEPSPVSPPTINDHFNLVTTYGQWDDHDPQNVDPLVRNLAFLMDTDDMQLPHDGHIGTRWQDMESGIKQYLIQQGVAGMFEVHNQTYPQFEWMESEIEKCQDVELFLEFWQWTGSQWTNQSITNPSLEFGHFVTCAGVNSTTNELLISDPLQDAFEAGVAPRGGRSPVPHPAGHPSQVHNDTQFVSHDAYLAIAWTPPPPPPPFPQPVVELVGYLQTLGYPASFHTFITAAVATSPLGAHDVAVTNVTTSKTGCTPMPTVGQNRTITVNVTVENRGSFNETSVNVTAYAAPSMPPAIVINSTIVSLDAGKNMTISLAWNTTGLAIGNYTVSATAGPVPGETNTTNNTFTDGTILITIPGDINGDLKVSLADLVLLANAYGSKPGDVKWNPNADLDDNKIIGLSDLVILANHYGQHYP